ncbi:MAG: hypothetical protein WC508_04175 [Patescibacteria group bacterium]
MDIGEAMQITLACRQGSRLCLRFKPEFDSKTESALAALVSMNDRYFTFSSKTTLSTLQVIMAKQSFCSFRLVVTVEVFSNFLGKRREFLAPLVAALESITTH